MAATTSTASAQQPSGSLSFMVFGDPAELAAYQALVDAFEAREPGIDVQLIHIPSASDYRARLGADFAAGDPADVVLINYRRYAPFAAMGVLEPLAPYLRASDVISAGDFYQVATEPFTWRGQLMCIPQNISSLVVYYDRDLFDAAGLPYPTDDWTWDEFLAAAKALTLDLDGDGTTDQYGVGIEPSIFRLAPFVWANGGELVVLESGQRPIRLALDSRASREAVEWFVALQTEHGVVPDAVAAAARDDASRFLDGTTAMYFDSRRFTPTARTIDSFAWDVAALPVGQRARGHPALGRLLHGCGHRGQGRGLGLHRVRQLARGPGHRGSHAAGRCPRCARWPSRMPSSTRPRARPTRASGSTPSTRSAPCRSSPAGSTWKSLRATSWNAPSTGRSGSMRPSTRWSRGRCPSSPARKARGAVPMPLPHR